LAKQHSSLELLHRKKKQLPSIDLSSVKRQLAEINSQLQVAKAFPVALLDSARLETIIRETVAAYGVALEQAIDKFQELDNSKGLTEFKEQIGGQFQQLLSVLKQIQDSLVVQRENVGLEREALTALVAYLEKVK